MKFHHSMLGRHRVSSYRRSPVYITKVWETPVCFASSKITVTVNVSVHCPSVVSAVPAVPRTLNVSKSRRRVQMSEKNNVFLFIVINWRGFENTKMFPKASLKIVFGKKDTVFLSNNILFFILRMSTTLFSLHKFILYLKTISHTSNKKRSTLRIPIFETGKTFRLQFVCTFTVAAPGHRVRERRRGGGVRAGEGRVLQVGAVLRDGRGRVGDEHAADAETGIFKVKSKNIS